MPNPSAVPADMKLYSPMEPEGRMFSHGEPWPGDVWSDKPGGEPVGTNAAAGALKDLIEANDRLDHLGQQLASKDHDLAVMAAARDAANGKVDDLTERAVAAEKAQAQAEDAAKGYMKERDQARTEVASLTAQIETLTAPSKAAKADA